MANLKILNKKQIKEIYSALEKQFGFSSELDYAFMINEKNRVYIINKKFGEIDTAYLRVDTLGLYFGEFRNNTLRASIEGSQLIWPLCKKNIVEISEGLMKLWIRGYDIEVNEKEMHDKNVEDGFVLVKHENDFLGCGNLKQGKIMNYIPKIRRIRSS